MANKFDTVRNDFMNTTKEMFEKQEYEVLTTGSNEFCVPIVNESGDEAYLVITFKIPKGSRDGEVYDGYSVAEDYRMKVEAKKAKAEEAARKKAEKIERDRKTREGKARIKSQIENFMKEIDEAQIKK